MNFLAHAYLSFGHPEILVGNLVSDFVKGAAYKNFPEPIQHGIRLHRRIDAFTDEHPATRTARTLFVPHYRLYSGALVDILYDHYLANDPEHFSEESLYAFTQQVYRTLEQHAPVLPNRFVQAFTYMRAENWLFHYRTVTGIGKSLSGLVRRAAYLSDHRPALGIFEQHYEELRVQYAIFIKDVKEFSKKELEQFLS